VGHVRSYSAVAVVGAAAILMHPLMDPAAWFALRFVLGFSFAAVFMVIESWLNGAVANAEQGRTLGLYMAAT
jgi:MFS family permease